MYLYQEAGLYTVRASNREGSCIQSWKLEMVEHPKADTQSAQSSAREDEDEEIVPDESVVSGDITDPEFLQIMVKDISFLDALASLRSILSVTESLTN